MRAVTEHYFLNPPPGSAAERAAEFGIDLTLTLQNLRLTPEERIRKLDDFIEGVAKLKTSVRIIGPTNAITDLAKRAAGRPKDLIALPELEAIKEERAIANDIDKRSES